MISRVACLILLAAFFAAAQGVLRVASLEDLRSIGQVEERPLSADYELVCDIDASESRVRPFDPIGGGGRPFTGRFFGRGGRLYVIRNLYIRSPSEGHVGLFGVVGYGAEVSNVGVVADTVSGSFAVGALAGSNNGRIVNCYGAGVVVAGRRESNVGGLVGLNGGGIYGSYSAAKVCGAENVGGLVGLLRISASGEISQCFALGAVRGDSNVGGLVGQVFGGRVAESFSAGRVFGAGAAGGLIGRDFAVSLSSWSDRGVFEVDGVSGYVAAAEVIGSFWDSEASGQSASAGGEGRRTALMKSRETFAGWDFGGVWAIEEGAGYPQLARVPYNTRNLGYAVDRRECGRIRISGADGVAEAYGYGVELASGAFGPEVTAEAWDGCRFAGWSDGAKTAGRTDAALRDTVFTAKFERVGGSSARVFRYGASSGGALRAAGVFGLAAIIDTALKGAWGPAVAAAPGAGYRFAGWSDGIASVTRADSASGPNMITAVFQKNDGAVIEVSRYDDLYLIGKYGTHPLDGNYELVCDIEIPASGRLEPIGSASAPFTGVFAGNGYKVSGLDAGRGGRAGDFAGLFGYADGAVIRGVFVEGRAAGVDNVGMLVGKCVNTVIDSCGVSGSARGRSGVGGLVGRSVGSLISRSYSAVSVDGEGDEVGGLAGGAWDSFLAQSYAICGVKGSAFVGGAVGFGMGGLAQDCYAAGEVYGEGPLGGFICYAGGGIGVSRSYSAGLVLGVAARAKAGMGGFAGTLGGGNFGSAGGAVLMTGCYWDVGKSGMNASAGGVGASTAEMRLAETYAGWDFESVWEINGGYPKLRGLAPDSIPGIFAQQRRTPSPEVSVRPPVRVVGRAVYVNARQGERVQIRLIDMKGKIVARYNVTGTKKLSIDKAASGAYIVEARRSGRRIFVSSMRIFK
jgi:hypothetical protein